MSIMLSVTYAYCHLRSVSVMLNVTYKQNFMLNVVMFNVVMLGIVAPVFFSIFLHFYFDITKIELHTAESSHLGRT